MTHIKIQTLTPVHIGNGRALQGNFEYLYFQKEHKIAVIDEEKVFNIIGAENLDKWLGIIRRKENLLTYLQSRKADLTAESTALRTMRVIGNKVPNPENTVREFIHSGNREPILPGSSLKGAIRTALLTESIRKEAAFIKNSDNLHKQKFDKNLQKKVVINYNRYEDEEIDSHYFGKDPNHDIMRLLQVRDVHFDKTVCILSETVNHVGKGLAMKNEVKQFVECLPENSLSLGWIHIPEKLKNEAQRFNYFGKDLSSFTFSAIFQAINLHTLRLLDKEINVWQTKVLPDGAAEYVENLQLIYEQIKKCEENTCILRVGYGIGYNFMTGSWQPGTLPDQTLQSIALAVRRKEYPSMPFPKSRRLTLNGRPMGFIKMIAVDEIGAQQYVIEKERLRQIQLENERQVEETRQLQDEAKRKPQYFTGKIKAGLEIDAEVVGQDPRNPNLKLFKLFVSGPGQEQTIPLKYVAPLTKGAIVRVKIVNEQKGKIQSIEFKGFKMAD